MSFTSCADFHFAILSKHLHALAQGTRVRMTYIWTVVHQY